ncbi:S49 family peptidase [Neisseria leonii]|uniref:S49 family peptidase n=1 Tax=Neisseria leonii TaxID=2995413 RepID=UPI00237BB4B8|nr:S49 family peptidase [Neisseria sp. 3986]MDD9324866.1 S49 family peptidase [Neisseria sp. 3986]
MTFKIRREEEKRDSVNGLPDAAAQPWERQVVEGLIQTAYRDQRSARFWRNVWRGVSALLFAATLFTLHSCGGGFSMSGGSRPASKPHTAVIRLNGEIGGSRDQAALLREGLEAAYANSSVKGIIIRADSPGGSPVMANTAFKEIRRLKADNPEVPVYVVAEDMCASGCYYIAAAADKIYADPSSLIGSIGVIGGGFDFTGLMDKLGVKRRLRIAGGNKGMGDPFSPETPEQQAIWQEMLNDIHQEFIKAVREGRKGRLKEQQFPDLFSGRIYTGNEAQKAGLIDGFGDIYSVSRDEFDAPELVDYTPEDDELTRLLGRRLGSEIQNGWNSLRQTW